MLKFWGGGGWGGGPCDFGVSPRVKSFFVLGEILFEFGVCWDRDLVQGLTKNSNRCVNRVRVGGCTVCTVYLQRADNLSVFLFSTAGKRQRYGAVHPQFVVIK